VRWTVALPPLNAPKFESANVNTSYSLFTAPVPPFSASAAVLIADVRTSPPLI
jgi:hypothetical protein